MQEHLQKMGKYSIIRLQKESCGGKRLIESPNATGSASAFPEKVRNSYGIF